MRTECEKYRKFMTVGDHNEALNHRIYRFPNNYGASVIEGYGSHGLELMKLMFDDDGQYIMPGARGEYYWRNEPIGYMNEATLEAVLTELFNMPDQM